MMNDNAFNDGNDGNEYPIARRTWSRSLPSKGILGSMPHLPQLACSL